MLAKSELIALIENTKKIDSGNHYANLLGERQAGSKWNGEMTEEILMSLEWHDNTGVIHPEAKIPGCKYYVAYIRDVFPKATVGAVALHHFDNDVEAAGDYRGIEVVDGAHGKELHGRGITDWASHTHVATMIVGEETGTRVIFTVHPGCPLAPLPKDFNGDLDALPRETAVKLI